MNMTIIAGSNRKGAVSTQVVAYMKRLLEREGHRVNLFDLYEQPLPVYSPDEAPDHPNVVQMGTWMNEADAVILSTPEYHGSMSGVMKNALDFLGGQHFDGKPTLLVSTAGGPVGVGSLSHLQAVVRNLHGIVSPEWVSIGGSTQEITADGEPADTGTKERIKKALAVFIQLTEAVSRNHSHSR